MKTLINVNPGKISLDAANVNIADAGSKITATTVEGALQEIATNLATETTNRTSADSTHSGSATAHAAQNITYSGSVTGQTQVKGAIDALKTRIENVATGATVDSEVIDARQSASKNITYDSLDARLEAVELDASLQGYAQGIIRELVANNLRTIVPSGVVDYVYEKRIGMDSTIVTPRGQIQVCTTGYFVTNMFNISPFTTTVNGYTVTVCGWGNTSGNSSKGNIITMNAPPSLGYREDLVFLEVWLADKAVGDNVYAYGRRTSNEVVDHVATAPERVVEWRLRVVDGVDFVTYPDGFHKNTVDKTATAFNTLVTPQGGSGSPVTALTTSELNCSRTLFCPASIRGLTNMPNIAIGDFGLYVAGDGTSSKTTLATADGYVYAIPLFRVKRRNSAGYSEVNTYGARNYYTNSVNPFNSLEARMSFTITLANATFYNNVNIGDVLCDTNHPTYLYKIISKDSGTNVTAQQIGGSYVVTTSSPSSYFTTICILSDCPSGLYANIIDARDIIDLRHRVSLTGYNYDFENNQGLDLLSRFALNTKDTKTMLTTYNGVNKTPIDSNTVFYAGFDGTTTAELGTLTTNITTPTYKPCATGIGLYIADGKYVSTDITVGQTAITVSGWFNTDDLWTNAATSALRAIFGFVASLGFEKTPTTDQFCIYDNGQYNFTVAKPATPMTFVRVIYVGTTMSVYFNGTLVYTRTVSVNSNTITNVKLGFGTASWGYVGTVSDFSVSTIDRGTTFATLPADFIAGTARVAPAFGQRSIYSDALTGQYTFGKASIAGYTDPGITPSRTSGDWTADDTIKVKGNRGEVISGVIDTDTALAQLIKDGDTTGVLYLNDVSKFTNGDTCRIVYWSANKWNVSASITLNTVDTTNKTVTSIGSDFTGYCAGGFLVEDTVSSSVPLVKATISNTAQAGGASTVTLATTACATDDYYNTLTITITSGTGVGQVRTISDYVGSTKVATVSVAWTTQPDATSVYSISRVPITGTWSNLGTTEATFTLGTNTFLVAQDLSVEYSLNAPAGQGGISEVLVETLQGEVKGKKLVPFVSGTTPMIRDDFTGKVAGSTVECPHWGKIKSGMGVSTLPTPTTVNYELDSYTDILTLNGTPLTLTKTDNGGIAHVVLAYNLIRKVEDKYGAIPASDTAGKVAWLQINIKKITLNWWGYGSCPTGNKASLSIRNVLTGAWVLSQSNTTSSSSKIYGQVVDAGMLSYVDNSGFIYCVAHTDASDGVTASTINTDYCNIEVELVVPSGFDALVPDNPNRNDYLVRTATFANKVAASVLENPNTFKACVFTGTTPPVPSDASWSEIGQSDYDKTLLINGTSTSAPGTITNNNQAPGHLISLNLIAEYERNYGTIPAKDTTGKVAWIKANVNKVVCNWWGKGECPVTGVAGNKAKLSVWNNISSWVEVGTTTNSAITKVSYTVSSGSATISNITDGFIYFLVNVDASDGVIGSTLYTDYIEMQISFKGQSNVLFIRKETKEIQTMFPANNGCGIKVWGNYIPYQGVGTGAGILVGGSPVLANAYRATTLGTAVAKTTPTSLYAGMISQLPIGTQINDYDFIGQDITTANTAFPLLWIKDVTYDDASSSYFVKEFSTTGSSTTYAAKRGYSQGFIQSSSTITGVWKLKPVATVTITGKVLSIWAMLLKTSNGELVLVTATVAQSSLIDFNPLSGNVAGIDAFRLPGRPLSLN